MCILGGQRNRIFARGLQDPNRAIFRRKRRDSLNKGKQFMPQREPSLGYIPLKIQLQVSAIPSMGQGTIRLIANNKEI